MKGEGWEQDTVRRCLWEEVHTRNHGGLDRTVTVALSRSRFWMYREGRAMDVLMSGCEV